MAEDPEEVILALAVALVVGFWLVLELCVRMLLYAFVAALVLVQA